MTKLAEHQEAEREAFYTAPKDIVNDSGLVPVDYQCVVRLDPVEEKQGMILKPDDTIEREQMAATRGRLLATGGNAFSDWEGRVPAIGDRVLIRKYAGIVREADMRDPYRIVQDKEILAVVTE